MYKMEVYGAGKKSNSPSYETTKARHFLVKQKLKIIKRTIETSQACKGFLNTYNVETLGSFNPEKQFKDTESAIKKS